MAELVYFLCAATSIACAVLLLRSFLRTRLRLLLWSGLSFVAFAATNILLFVDVVMLPEADLSLYRMLITLAGVVTLLYGLVWDIEK